jgi:methionyl-tRNA formyltransferase
MDGQTETGLTTFFIEKDIDTGMIIEQARMGIGPNENAGSLHDRMMARGAELLLSTVQRIASGTTEPKSQKEILATMPQMHEAPKIFKEDCEIDWAMPATAVHNHARGLSPYPGAWTSFADSEGTTQTFKIFETAISPLLQNAPHGTVRVVNAQMLVKASDAWLEVIELQAPGKKRMKAADFIRGYRPPVPWTFGASATTAS